MFCLRNGQCTGLLHLHKNDQATTPVLSVTRVRVRDGCERYPPCYDTTHFNVIISEFSALLVLVSLPIALLNDFAIEKQWLATLCNPG